MNLIANANNNDDVATFYWQVEGMTLAMITLWKDGGVEFRGENYTITINSVGSVEEMVNLHTTR